MKTKLLRPILVNTINPSKLQLSKRDSSLAYHSAISKDFNCFHESHWIPKQLILISLEDEKIEVGDKVYHPNTSLVEVIEIERLISYSNYKFKTIDERCWICDLTNETKKVIATQDQLSPEYIQQFVEQYNNGKVENIEIEMDAISIHKGCEQVVSIAIDCKNYQTTICNTCDKGMYFKSGNPIVKYIPKLTNGFITIVENNYEIIGKPIEDYIRQKHSQDRCMGFIDGYKSRKSEEYILYTEEECYRKLHNLMTDIKLCGYRINDDADLIYWFNQNKKK